MNEISKSQIDLLGDRLRKGHLTESDLKMLDQYRRSFVGAYEEAIGVIRQQLILEPTGRPAKSTTSIIEKLQRESIRLSQVQDIAGCRVIITDIQAQDKTIDSFSKIFSNFTPVDRRKSPSYGYRAVHIIIKINQKLVEVQIRTELQHGWAELSEKFSDTIDPAIKYGKGNKEIQDLLLDASNLVKDYEDLEETIPVEESEDARIFRDKMLNLKKQIITYITNLQKRRN